MECEVGVVSWWSPPLPALWGPLYRPPSSKQHGQRAALACQDTGPRTPSDHSKPTLAQNRTWASGLGIGVTQSANRPPEWTVAWGYLQGSGSVSASPPRTGGTPSSPPRPEPMSHASSARAWLSAGHPEVSVQTLGSCWVATPTEGGQGVISSNLSHSENRDQNRAPSPRARAGSCVQSTKGD